ncbi:MAG: hypothetical protein K2M34_05040 [Alphaproteobacteria bacterium]|nr:hypothetical protein [Alphaproteobacteria bacterium]
MKTIVIIFISIFAIFFISSIIQFLAALMLSGVKKATETIKNNSLENELESVLSSLDNETELTNCLVYKKIRKKVLQTVLNNSQYYLNDKRPPKVKLYNMIGNLAAKIYASNPSFSFFDASDETNLIKIWNVVSKKMYEENLITQSEYENLEKTINKLMKDKASYDFSNYDLGDAIANNPLNPGNSL